MGTEKVALKGRNGVVWIRGPYFPAESKKKGKEGDLSRSGKKNRFFPGEESAVHQGEKRRKNVH